MSELKKTPHMLPSPGSNFTTPIRAEGAKRLSAKRGRENKLFSLTQDIIGTYKRCNPAFKAIEVLPQRILTVPSEGVHNGGRDNEDSNLICRVNDVFDMDGYTFTVLDLLGTGTFGQVFRCIRSDTKHIVAVKVVKNKPAYHAQGLLEIKVARLLNQTHDPNDERHIVRLLDSFEYHGHVCLVFELLSVSLLDVLTQNQFRGLPLVVVQRFTRQILTALVAMEEADVIHCDLKPENILLVPSQSNPSSPARKAHQTPADADSNNSNRNSSNNGSSGGGDGGGGAEQSGSGVDGESAAGTEAKTSPGNPSRRSSGGVSDVKVIDFGSACFEGHTMYSYIQSRFYRSPEVLLGLPYNGAIDMWSLACVCAEMYLGLPLFPGVSQHNQLSRIVEMLGLPPDFLLEGKNGRKYFTAADAATPGADKDAVENSPQSVCVGSAGTSAIPGASGAAPSGAKYRIKTAEEFAAETNSQVPVLRKYLRYSRLDEVIMRCPLPQKARMTAEQKNIETIRRRCFLDFLQGLFRLNPFERWTARQAFSHPFIENTMFVGPYVPPPDMKINERKLNFMVLTQRKPPPNTAFEGATLTGVRAPSNFSTVPGLLGGNSAQFTPLQLAQRRMSDPGLGSATAKQQQASGPQLLKRGAPAHLASEQQQQPKTSPGIAAESAIPFSSIEVEHRAEDRALNADSASRMQSFGLPPPVEQSGQHPDAAARSFSDGIADADKSVAQELAGGGGNVARSIMRVNSKGRDLQNLATAMQQQQQAAGSPTQQAQYLAQQAQYQQFPHAPHQQQPPHGQSQSLQSSPQAQKYIQQYRQQQFLAQQAQQQSYMRQQHQAQQAQRGNISFPPPPRPYFTAQPPQPQQAHIPMQYAAQPILYPNYAGQMSSSMHSDSTGMNMPGNAPGSSVGSSYNSYGYVGSMQDGGGGVILTDFALALMRPDMDEQRRLLSQTNSAPMYWQQSYAPGTSPGSLPTMGGAYGYTHGGHGMPDPYPSMHMGYGYPPSAGQGDPRQGYYHPSQPQQQQPQQQAGSFDSKTMHARRRQQQQAQQQHLQDRNNSANNLADLASHAHSGFQKAPTAPPVPDIAEDSRSNNNNVKRLSGRIGQNKDTGGSRSGASLLQSSLHHGHADLHKPSPAYSSKDERAQLAPPPPQPQSLLQPQDTTRTHPAPTSGVIKISAEGAHKAPARVDVIAGSYVDTANQHTFHPLRHKDPSLGGGGSFLSMEIERRESFVAAAQPSLGPSSPGSTASNSAATSNANSRQNSIDSSSSPGAKGRFGSPHEKGGAVGGSARRGSPGRTQAHKAGRIPHGAKRGTSNEDVLEEWHPFFEADAI